jgi:hypothetical protein
MFFHASGIDIFFPPAPGMTYWIGIFPPSWNAEEEISIASPPKILFGAISR